MFDFIFRLFLASALLSTLAYAEKLEKVSLQLQWKYQFQFAGFIVAKERGYYKDVGLDVTILEYNNSNSMQDLEDGKIDFAINNSIIFFKNKKLKKVTLLATYFQRSPLILIAQPEIKTVLDLKGKTISMSKHDSYSSSLSILLKYFSIDFQNTHFVKPTFNLDAFIAKKIDATTAFRSNELFELDKKHIPYSIIDPVEYGFATNAINLFTSQKKVKNNPEQIKYFLEASKKGWKYALSHLDEVAKLIHSKYRPNLPLAQLEYEAKATKKLMLLDLYDIGEVNEEFVNKTFKKLQKLKQLDKLQKADKLTFESKQLDTSFKIHFSKEEKEWIKKNPVVTYSEVNKKPLSIIENGKMHGIMGEYLSLVAQRSGLKFKFIKSDSWQNVLEKFQKNEINIVPGIGSSPQEMKLGSLSSIYAEYPMVIVTGKKYKYISSLDKLNNKIIAVPKCYTSYNFLKENFPKIVLLPTKNIKEALLLVQAGKADAFVGHIATSLYYMSLLHLNDLKIVGTAPFKFEHRFLIHKDNPILLGIINKVFRSLSAHDKEIINTKWISGKVENNIDLTPLYWVISIIVFIIFLVLFRQHTLSKYNRELKQLKERMELALSSSDSGIWDWDLEYNTLYLSPQWKKMLGYRENELETKLESWKKSIHPDDIADVIAIVKKDIKEKVKYKEMSYRLVKKDKSTIWVLSKAMTEYDQDGEPVRIIGTHINITHAKAREFQNLQQAQIIEQIHDSVITTDLEGNITSFNHGSEVLLGYNAEEIIGKHISEINVANSREKIVKGIRLLKIKEKYHLTAKYRKKTDEIIYVDLSLSLLRDEKGIIIGVIGFSQDITHKIESQKELLRQKDILSYQAHHDTLTDLPNRAYFNERLEQSISKAKRHHYQIALFFIDLDHFKEINDSLGHAVGDEVLIEVTRRLSRVIRKEDVLARLGGDEFTIITEGIEKSSSAAALAQKIIGILSEPIALSGHLLYVTSSIGISLYPNDGESTTNLLKYADAAMYKAKDNGRNNFQFYSSEMTDLAFEKVHMETSLREALKNSEFVVYYQPQVDGEKNKLKGMEALVRWKSPSEGLVPPIRFIPIAEITGLIVKIDREVMKMAMAQFTHWKSQGLFPIKLSLNLAIKHLYADDFLEVLDKTMEEYSFNANELEFEVVESEIMSNPDEAIKILNKLRDRGISLSVDDFGTGYSSLSYLKRLPIKKLKIDQSFIKDLPYDEEDIAISKAVIALAKSLNLDIIAEGVERKEQKDFLIYNGCVNIQGYYYSKPVNAEAMTEILLNGFSLE